MKSRMFNWLLIVVFFAGLSLLLYPQVSNYWNSIHQSRAISGYTQQVENLDSEQNERLLQEAADYNARLAGLEHTLLMDENALAEYYSLLDITGTGIMGYVEIPQINCSLPIYHGTDDAVLQIASGHIPGTSLPVGGESTHCVISGHRGLPSAKLFSDIDQLVEGDVFTLRTLNTVMTYEVTRILIVLPHEVGSLQIEQGQDLCTLVTCTPYGINTHRLLITGTRIDNRTEAAAVRITSDAAQVDPLLVAPVLAVPPLLLIVLFVMLQSIVTSLFPKKKR